MLHNLIENEEAFHFARKNIKPEETVTWHTTSPWLLEKLPLLGEKVFSLEENLAPGIYSSLGFASIDFADSLVGEIDDLCADFIGSFQIGKTIRHSIRRTMFILLYKSFLLEKWYQDFFSSESKFQVVGSSIIPPSEDFSIDVDRFANVYTWIASRTNYPNLSTLEHQANFEQALANVRRDKIPKTEIFLSLISQEFSTLMFVFWLNLKRRGILPKKSIQLPGKTQPPTIFFLKLCELATESFWPVFMGGGRVVYTPQILKLDKCVPENLVHKVNLEQKISEHLQRALEAQNLPYQESYRVCEQILANKIYEALPYAHGVITQLPTIKKRFAQYVSENFSIATNGLTSSRERLIQQYLIQEKIPIFTFEHGVTAGVNGTTTYLHSQGGYADESDLMVCYSKASKEAYLKNKNICGGVVSGAPWENKKIRFYKLQRFLTRKLLKVKSKDRLICLLPALATNNSQKVPLNLTDWEYHNIMKIIGSKVLAKIKDPSIMKLYPSTRYLDPEPYEKLGNLPEHVRVLKYFEFKYLRAASDVIILLTATSTLGWAWSSEVPLIFIEFPNSPILPDVSKLLKESIFLIDGGEDSWEKELKKLLDMPSKELLKQWKTKAKKRKIFEENYVFGAQGNSGKRSAKYILEKTKENSRQKYLES